MLISRHHTTSLALALIISCTCIGLASAQSSRILQTPQGVTIKAENAALGDLLTELAALSGRIAIHLDPSERSVPVTVDVETAAVADAMYQVVKASGLDFVMNGRVLWAGRAKKATEAAGKYGVLPEEPPATPVAMDATGAIIGPVRDDPTADDFGERVSAPIVPFSGNGESLRVDQRDFIPFKLRPEAIKARRSIDITKIP